MVVTGISLVMVCNVTSRRTNRPLRTIACNAFISIAFSLVIAGSAAAGTAPEAGPDGPVATVAVQPPPLTRGFPDEAVIIVVGAALIALGTAVRRSA